nr:hypothetical protein [Kineosporia corallincola]
MPEAAVYEDGDLGSGEHDVRADPAIGKVNAKILAESMPASMQGRSDGHFWLGIGAAYGG